MRFWDHRERHLYFNDCHIKRIHPSTFHYVPSFAGISLSRNHAIKHSDFKYILDDLSVDSLTFLDLSDMNIYDINHLSVTLKYSVKLEKLDLSNNKLKVIPKGIFFFLTKLRILDLSQNMIRYIENLAGLVRLERLILASNDLKTLSEDMFSGLQELQHLDVSFNDLNHIESGVLAELFSLQTINAQGNSIDQVDLGGGLENLQSFNLKFNKVSNLNFVSSLPNLYFLSISHNSLTNLTNAFLIRSQRLRELDMSKNSIIGLSRHFFEFLQAYKVDLSSNKLSRIEYYGWNSNNKIKILNLQNNGANEIDEESFVNMIDLIELNLGKNRLTYLPNNLFKHMVKLKVLNLSENPLGKYFEDDHYIFSSLSNLRHLTISHVGLWVLRKQLFITTTKLTQLDISNNRINQLFFPFIETFPELTIFNASNNKLTTIKKDISNHFSSNQRSLDISGNLFQCDCDLLPTCHLLSASAAHTHKQHHYNPMNDINFISLVSNHHTCYQPASKRGSSVGMECEVMASSCEQVIYYTSIFIAITTAVVFLILTAFVLTYCLLKRKNKNIKEKKQIPETYLENSKLLPVSGIIKITKEESLSQQDKHPTEGNVYKTTSEHPINPLIAMYCGLNRKGLKVDLDSSKSTNSTSSNSDQSMSNPLYANKQFV